MKEYTAEATIKFHTIVNDKDGYHAEDVAVEWFDKLTDRFNSDYVTFILHDGTEIQVSRYDENVPSFIINGADEVLGVAMGATIQLNVTEKNVVEYSILKPDGWRVNYENGILTITAPEKENQYAEKEGVVAINATLKGIFLFIYKRK